MNVNLPASARRRGSRTETRGGALDERVQTSPLHSWSADVSSYIRNWSECLGSLTPHILNLQRANRLLLSCVQCGRLVARINIESHDDSWWIMRMKVHFTPLCSKNTSHAVLWGRTWSRMYKSWVHVFTACYWRHHGKVEAPQWIPVRVNKGMISH